MNLVNKKFAGEKTNITTFVLPEGDGMRIKNITMPSSEGKKISFGDKLRYALRVGLSEIEKTNKPAQTAEPAPQTGGV